jgi:hypothetical protein
MMNINKKIVRANSEIFRGSIERTWLVLDAGQKEIGRLTIIANEKAHECMAYINDLIERNFKDAQYKRLLKTW